MTRQPKAPPPETIFVPSDTDGISCDGGGGPLGHPKVWYTFEQGNEAECGYCDRLFIRKAS